MSDILSAGMRRFWKSRADQARQRNSTFVNKNTGRIYGKSLKAIMKTQNSSSKNNQSLSRLEVISKKLVPSNGPTRVLEALSSEFHNSKTTHRKWLMCAKEDIYSAALVLRDSPSKWARFCSHPDWNEFTSRPKVGNPSEALRYATRFVAGKKHSSWASKVHVALKPAFKANTPAGALISFLKKMQADKNEMKLHKAPKDLSLVKAPLKGWGSELLDSEAGDVKSLSFLVVSKTKYFVILQKN